MTIFLKKKKLGLQDYKWLIDAIQVSDAPIAIDSNSGWAIYQSEWASHILYDPEQVKGSKFWIYHEEKQEAHPVDCEKDIALIIGDTIECPFEWTIKTTSGEYWMETDTSDFFVATNKALSQCKDMTIISLSLNR